MKSEKSLQELAIFYSPPAAVHASSQLPCQLQSPYTPLAFVHSGNSAESPLCDKQKYDLNFQFRAESQMQIASREAHTLWKNRGLLTFPSFSRKKGMLAPVPSISVNVSLPAFQ